MDVSFGTRLRSQREQQQVALGAIAERTKIKVSLLEGLERDDVSQWPTGIFRRSFVRAYAHAIGLDPDTVVREFLERYPDPEEEDIPAVLAAAQRSRRPPTRLGYLLASAIGALPAVRGGGSRSRATQAPQSPEDTELAFDESAPVIQQDLVSACPEPAAVVEAVEDQPEPLCVSEPALEANDDLVEAQVVPPASDDLGRDLSAVAALCTRLARALHPRDLAPVLEESADVLQAVGLIVWMWDPTTRTLRHALAHGYSGDVLGRLPRVRFDTDNAIADAFRSQETRIVKGSGQTTGAVVVPMVTGDGCAGVLALELQNRREECESVRALTTILAAQLAALIGFPSVAAEAVSA